MPFTILSSNAFNLVQMKLEVWKNDVMTSASYLVLNANTESFTVGRFPAKVESPSWKSQDKHKEQEVINQPLVLILVRFDCFSLHPFNCSIIQSRYPEPEKKESALLSERGEMKEGSNLSSSQILEDTVTI